MTFHFNIKFPTCSYLFLLVLLVFSCQDEDNPQPMDESALLKVRVDNGRFVDSLNNTIFPWGFNYTNPEGVGLIEDDWFDNDKWQIIQSDFLEMKNLGANIIRIHLQYNKFMIDVNTPNESALNRLRELVDFAKQNKLYLDITGLAAYRASDQPSFYDNLADEDRWDTQAIFWESVANKVGDSPAVFAFNLMNEPVVSVDCDANGNCKWLPGDGFGGFHFVQNISRNPENKFVPTLEEWISKMTQSVRSKDDKTLITVGFLALGNYGQFSSELDYVSPHIYPRSGEIGMSINSVLANQSNKPLVIEEIANLNCNISELEEFLLGVQGNYDGLLGHYFGRTIEELDDGDIVQALQKNFLEFFVENNPN